MERNFVGRNFFDYDAYVQLAGRIKASDSPDAQEDLEALDDALTSFRDYVNKVDAGEQQIRLAAVRFEGEEYREMITLYDRRRHDQHEEAIINVRLVNRLAQIYGVSPLFLGDDADRLQVADFCLDTVVQIFNNRML